MIKTGQMKKCEFCGKEFYVPKWRENINKGKYCSKKCHNDSRKEHFAMKCENCGKLFEIKKSRKIKYNRKYCGRKCYQENRKKNKIQKRIKQFCLWCKKNLYITKWQKKMGVGKFCSKKCYSYWQRKNQIGKNSMHWKGGKVKKECVICGKIFYVDVFRKNGAKNCSRECSKKYQIGENTANWRGGKSFEPYIPTFTKRLKKQIRKRDNYTCQECNMNEKQLGYNLAVHHIDYDKKNSNLDNLISLCRSCHSQTNFNRDDWTKYYQNKMGGVI